MRDMRDKYVEYIQAKGDDERRVDAIFRCDELNIS